MARIEQGTKSQSKIPSSPEKPKFSKRILEGIKQRAIEKRNALRSMALALGIGAMVSCAPAAVKAEDTTPKKEVAAAVEKSEIEYNILTDASELEPYFKNAKEKFITFKPNETKEVGEYMLTARSATNRPGDTINMRMESKDGSYEKYGGLIFPSLAEVNVLEIDMGNDNPRVKGKMAVFATNSDVWFLYYDKETKKHELIVVALYDENTYMRRGPINTGYGIDDDGVFVINAPKDLKPGDIICQAGLWNDGMSGPGWFKYVPEQKPGKVALK